MNKVFDNIKFGEILEQKGITQAWVAKQLRVTKYTISRYKTGYREPGYPTIKALANVLGVKEKDLLTS
jgi:transcriptional regulator with XRE-family HTH domain